MGGIRLKQDSIYSVALKDPDSRIIAAVVYGWSIMQIRQCHLRDQWGRLYACANSRKDIDLMALITIR